MGAAAVKAIEHDARFAIAGLLVRRSGQAHANHPTYDEPEQLMTQERPDVWLDLTDATSVVRHVDLAIARGVCPVVGATGYHPDDLERWQHASTQADIGAIVAPNFAVGALLMMRFAAEAARFLGPAEIIELHHDGKKDAPSGTAKRTANIIAQARLEAAASPSVGQTFMDSEARGMTVEGIPVHSVRLPGLVAHQEVMFGGTGEVLTIRHDSLSRDSFMPGVLVACEAVMRVAGLVYGLEHILW